MKKGWLDFVIYLSWIFVAFVAILDLFIVPYRSIVWFVSLMILLYVYFKFKHLPQLAYLALVSILILNIFGELFFEFYYVYEHYDKVLHLINPVMGSIFFYYLFEKKVKDKKKRALYAVLSIISFSIFWELVEILFDKVFGSLMRGVNMKTGGNFFNLSTGYLPIMTALEDTILDLIMSFSGTLIFYLGFLLFNRRK